MKDTQSVTLNVGGQKFVTTRDTMASYKGFLKSLSQMNYGSEMFIDRDGTLFRYILNYLRGSPVLPESTHELEQLLVEADFYSLPHLKESIELRLKTSCPSLETTMYKFLHTFKHN